MNFALTAVSQLSIFHQSFCLNPSVLFFPSSNSRHWIDATNALSRFRTESFVRSAILITGTASAARSAISVWTAYLSPWTTRIDHSVSRIFTSKLWHLITLILNMSLSHWLNRVYGLASDILIANDFDFRTNRWIF